MSQAYKSFENITKKVSPPLLIIGFACIAISLFANLFGDTSVKNIYLISIPASVLATGAYMLIALLSLKYLSGKNDIFYIMARQLAPIGCIFCLISIFTISLIEYHELGFFWSWNNLQTTSLILLFLYCGYLGMHNAFEDKAREAKLSSIIVIIGAINFPIIKFALGWWGKLHQSNNSTKLPESIDVYFSIIGLGMLCLALLIWFYRTKSILLDKQMNN